MQTIRYAGRIDVNGSIRLPNTLQHKLGVRAGDKVDILISSFSNGASGASKSKTQMSQAKQRRMNDLLFRNREDDLNLDEKNELEALVLEAQLLTIAKAQRMLQKSRKR